MFEAVFSGVCPAVLVLSNTLVEYTWKMESQDAETIFYRELESVDFPDTVRPERRKESYVIDVTEDSPSLLWAIDII